MLGGLLASNKSSSDSYAIIAGARGSRREVFFGHTNLNAIRNRGRSSRAIIQQRLYRDGFNFGSQFGEREYFGHRFSGFFVPPISSLYTFNLNCDDYCWLYFSSEPYVQNERRIINVGRYTHYR